MYQYFIQLNHLLNIMDPKFFKIDTQNVITGALTAPTVANPIKEPKTPPHI